MIAFSKHFLALCAIDVQALRMWCGSSSNHEKEKRGHMFENLRNSMSEPSSSLPISSPASLNQKLFNLEKEKPQEKLELVGTELDKKSPYEEQSRKYEKRNVVMGRFARGLEGFKTKKTAFFGFNSETYNIPQYTPFALWDADGPGGHYKMLVPSTDEEKGGERKSVPETTPFSLTQKAMQDLVTEGNLILHMPVRSCCWNNNYTGGKVFCVNNKCRRAADKWALKRAMKELKKSWPARLGKIGTCRSVAGCSEEGVVKSH